MTAADPNLSGINLSRPSDSGINLQTAGAFDLGHNDSIELAPLSDEELGTHKPETGKSGKPAPAAKPGKAAPGKAKPSLAATPPPVVKKGQKDIFDDTDFEVDVPMSEEDSSDDKTVQLEAVSDFDLEDSDSGSEVFAIDEEEVDQNAATAMAPRPSPRRRTRTMASKMQCRAKWPPPGPPTRARPPVLRPPWSSPVKPRRNGVASGSDCSASPRPASSSPRSSQST